MSILFLPSCTRTEDINEPAVPEIIESTVPVMVGEALAPFAAVPMSREDIHFDDLPFYLPDVDKLREFYQAFVIAMYEAESAQEQLELIKEFDRTNRSYTDMSGIARIQFSRSISDETEVDVEHFDNLFAQTAYYKNETLVAIVDSRFVAYLEDYFGVRVMESLRKSVREFSLEQAELIRQIRELENEYTRLFDEIVMHMMFDYEIFTANELWEMIENEQDSDEQRRMLAVYNSSLARFDAESRDIFSALLARRDQIAELAGYRSYVRYIFSRSSISLNEVNEFIRDVKATILPVWQSLVVEAENRGLDTFPYFENIAPLYIDEHSGERNHELTYELSMHILRNLIDEMGPMIDYLERNGFVDVMPREGKEHGGFVRPLTGIQVPFVFAYEPSPNWLFHEYAHAFDSFGEPEFDFGWRFNTGPEIWEITALGMEALATSKYELLYGDTSNYANLRRMYEMMSLIITATMYTEFEIALYENPDMRPAERDRLFAELSAEYSLPLVYWQSVHHFFSAPMYLISYAIGGVTAFELWQIMEEDVSQSKDMWLTFSSDSTELNLAARLENAGFSNPFDLQTLEAVTAQLVEIFNSENYWDMSRSD